MMRPVTPSVEKHLPESRERAGAFCWAQDALSWREPRAAQVLLRAGSLSSCDAKPVRLGGKRESDAGNNDRD
jgi:hypothetical protein